MDGHCASPYLLSSDGLPGAALRKASVLAEAEGSSATLRGAAVSPAARLWGGFLRLPARRLPADGSAVSDVCMMCASHTHAHASARLPLTSGPGQGERAGGRDQLGHFWARLKGASLYGGLERPGVGPGGLHRSGYAK